MTGGTREARQQVRVRMYGQGLGDCFLLAFPRTSDGSAAGAGSRPVYVVVDCGVIGGTPGGAERMRTIVADIRKTTQDASLPGTDGQPKGHVDLLVVTHEHWDHVSGFAQAEKDWQQIQVDALWLSWLEKPDAGLPSALKKIVEKQHLALAQAADRVARFGLANQHDTVLGLAAFLGDVDEQGFASAGNQVHGAFETAKSLVPDEKRRAYCEPGEVRRVPGTDAVAYVLGPPRNEARLIQMDPTTGAPETYGDETAGDANASPRPSPANGTRRDRQGIAADDFSLQRMAAGPSPFNAFAMPLLATALPVATGGTPDPDRQAALSPAADRGAPESTSLDLGAEKDVYDRSFPFSQAVRVPLPLAERYARAIPGGYPALESYFDETNHWRRVDLDWLGGADAFALLADSLTNNTTLALAFELPATGPASGPATGPASGGEERQVLLFAGDAQVGNWLSWWEIKAWTPVDGARPSQATPDIAGLLGRTALYKVGHHGSHNASLKAQGVERMPAGSALAAFVPVSPRVARDVMNWCHMPLDALMKALSERTQGRVVLPNGNVWPPVVEAELEEVQDRMGLAVSPQWLPAKTRGGTAGTPKQEIEGEVPLWVELAF